MGCGASTPNPSSDAEPQPVPAPVPQSTSSSAADDNAALPSTATAPAVPASPTPAQESSPPTGMSTPAVTNEQLAPGRLSSYIDEGAAAESDYSISPAIASEGTDVDGPPDPPELPQMKPDGAIILVVGGPGCGKDTQCNKLAEKYNCAHLSAVDLLKRAVSSNSQQGTMISNMIRNGQIVPAQVTLDLLKDAIKSRSGPYLVQGYPKTSENLDDLEKQCGSCTAVIQLNVAEHVLTERLIERGNTSNRMDDTPEAIQRRFRTFQLQSKSMLDELHARDGVIHTVDASQSVEEVFASACGVYEKILASG